MSQSQVLRRNLLWLVVFFCAASAGAQITNQLNTGYPENGLFHGSEIDNVQINNGGLHVEIPLTKVPGRGLDVASKVIYNSKNWMFKTRCFTSGGGFCEDDVQGDPLGNPTLAFYGAFDYIFTATSRTCQWTTNVFITIVGGYVLREPNGTKHHFVPDPLTSPTCVPRNYAPTVYADDGSGWIMQINTTDGSMVTAISKTGEKIQAACDLCATHITPAKIVDRNGNQIIPTSTCCGNSGLGGTDTLGRTIPANGGYYDSSGTLQMPTLTGSVSVAIQTDLCVFSNADSCLEKNTTWTLPNQLNLPNGDSFTFTYAQNAGGELTSMTLPTGGQISWTWGNWSEGGRDIASRTVSANGVTGTWTYNGLTVTDPANKDTVYTCIAGATDCDGFSKVQYFDGPAATAPLLETVTTDFMTAPLTPGAIDLLPIRVTTTWNLQNLAMKTETDWDTMNISGVGTVTWRNPIEKRIYDWAPVGATMPLLQRTDTSYRHLESDGQAYLNANITDLSTLVQVYDGAGNLLAQTQNTYDGTALVNTNSGSSCSAPSVPGHDYCNFGTGNLVRGNLTRASRWLNTTNAWINTNSTYDDLGNLRSTADPLGHTTTYDYTDNWGGTGCVTVASTFAFPTMVTNPKNQRTVTSYYPCTSLIQSKKDENDLAVGRSGTTFTYDLMNRLLTAQILDINSQILAKTAWTYNDTILPLSYTKTVTAAPSPDLVAMIILDGFGRTSQTIDSDPEGDVTSQITYDSWGRQVTVTNPHRSVAAATDGTTQYAYDVLGRTTDVTKPDNNKIHTDYAGSSVTVTDETLRQRRSVTDGLGRLIEVDEPGDAFSGVQAQGNIDIGQLKTAQVGGTPATPATAQVTISGTNHSKTTVIRCNFRIDPNCQPDTSTTYDTGKVFITVNSHEYDYFFGGSGDVADTSASVAQGIVNAIQADSGRIVNASVPAGGTVITMTAITGGTAGNAIGFSSSYTWNTNLFPTQGPSFTSGPASGSLSGGQEAVGSTTVTDHGTVTMTAGTFTTSSVPYGPGTLNPTAVSVAVALASALNIPGSGVTASTNGGTVITVTERAAGTAGNGVAVSTNPTSADSIDFSSPSFNVNPISLGGGADPYPSGLAHPYVTLYSYDGLNNLACVEQHGNASGSGCSSASSSDPSNSWRIRRFTYDSLSRLLTAKNPEAGTTTYQYNDDGILIFKTDARGVTVNYSPTGSPIDVLHRVTQKTYSDGTPTVTYQYDTGCCGVSPTNAIGRMTAAFSGNTELVFSYDPMGRIATQWDCPPSGIARGFCYIISASYDDTGKITSLTYPDNRVVTSAYNSAGRFLRTDLASFNGTAVNFNYYTVPQSTSVASWGYWPSGAMNRGTYGNAIIETTGYNNRLQTSSIAYSRSGTTFFSKSYNYADAAGHNNGNILAITDTLNSAKNQTFIYDSLNRILTGAQADNAFNLSYSYDPWGNMKETGTSNFQPLFDVTNRMVPSGSCSPNLSPYCYDAAGDLLMDNHNHVYAYDGEARIKGVDGSAAAYTYNAMGNRVRKDAGANSTEYFFFAGTVIAELNPSNSTWTDYIGYSKRIAKDTSSNGTGAQYYHGDNLGSARVMTDASGTTILDCTFNPFGEQVICSPDNPSNHYRFSGQEYDTEDGLDDFGARYFSSSMGRWLTPDWSARPVTVPYANFGDPQSLNLFLYVRNDPVSQADADGHISDENVSCLSSFTCYETYQEHMRDDQPGGWFSVNMASNASSNDQDQDQDASQSGNSGQSANNTTPQQMQTQNQSTATTQNGCCTVTLLTRHVHFPLFGLLFSHAILDVTAEDGHEYIISGQNDRGVLKLQSLDRNSTDKKVQQDIKKELKGTHVVETRSGAQIASAAHTLRTATMNPIKYHAFGINSNSVIHTLGVGAGLLGLPHPRGAVGWNNIAPIHFSQE